MQIPEHSILHKKQCKGILMLAGFVCMAALGKYAAELTREAMGTETTLKKVAITFDGDVIIGLSQEISCKEAVSMI